MSLGDVFEYGQAYVALSRVSCLEGLKLKGFNPTCVKAHPRYASPQEKERKCVFI